MGCYLPEATSVRAAVYDMLGRQVAVLAEGRLASGVREWVWHPEGIPAGVYLLRLQVGDRLITRPLVRTR